MNKLVLETLITNLNGVDNRVSAAMETLVLHTVRKVVRSLEFMSPFSDAVIDNLGFITQVAALVRFKQRGLAAEKGNIEDRFRQFVGAGIMSNPRQVSVVSEGSDRTPTDNSDDTTNPRTYSIQQSELGYEHDWHDARTSYAVSGEARNKPYRNKLARPYKRKYPPDVPAMTVIKPVSELFANSLDYRNYNLIRKSTCYEENVTNELNKLTKKTAVQTKDRTFSGTDPC